MRSGVLIAGLIMALMPTLAPGMFDVEEVHGPSASLIPAFAAA